MTSNSCDLNGTGEIELNFLLVGKKIQNNNNNNISTCHNIIVPSPSVDQPRIIVNVFGMCF